MPRVRLFGSGPERWVEMPLPPSQKKGKADIRTPDIPPPGNNQRATFAVLRELRSQFRQAGITEGDYWDMIKARLDIESRTEIDDATYAMLSAKLNLARRDRPAFQRLVKSVHNFKKAQQNS